MKISETTFPLCHNVALLFEDISGRRSLGMSASFIFFIVFSFKVWKEGLGKTTPRGGGAAPPADYAKRASENFKKKEAKKKGSQRAKLRWHKKVNVYSFEDFLICNEFLRPLQRHWIYARWNIMDVGELLAIVFCFRTPGAI